MSSGRTGFDTIVAESRHVVRAQLLGFSMTIPHFNRTVSFEGSIQQRMVKLGNEITVWSLSKMSCRLQLRRGWVALLLLAAGALS